MARKKERKIINAPPKHALDLVPRLLYEDALGVIGEPDNRKTLAKLERYGLRRATVTRIIVDTFDFDTVSREVLGEGHPYHTAGVKAVMQFGRAISILEKLLHDRAFAEAFAEGVNPIRASVEFLTEQQKTIAFLLAVNPEQYAAKPSPKTVKQMLQFQTFLLFSYMKDLIKRWHEGRDYEDVLPDSHIHGLILELLQKVYTHPSYGVGSFDRAKVKELSEIHRLERRTSAALKNNPQNIRKRDKVP